MTHVTRRTKRTTPKFTITEHTKNLIVPPKIFLTQNFLGPKILFRSKILFWPKIFSHLKLFQNHNFFSDQNLFFRLKILFLPKFVFDTNFFSETKILLDPNKFWTKIFLTQNVLDLTFVGTNHFFYLKFF